MNRRGNMINPVDTIHSGGEMLIASDASVEDGEFCYVRGEQDRGPLFVYQRPVWTVPDEGEGEPGPTLPDPDDVDIFKALYGDGVWVRTSLALGAPEPAGGGSEAELFEAQEQNRTGDVSSTPLVAFPEPPTRAYVVYGYLSTDDSGSVNLKMSITWTDPINGLIKTASIGAAPGFLSTASGVVVLQTDGAGPISFSIQATADVHYNYYIGARMLNPPNVPPHIGP